MRDIVSNDVYRVPLNGGPTARIRVQCYKDKLVWFSADPAPGDTDEPPAMVAIAILKQELELRGKTPRIVYRRYRPNGHGGRHVDVPDAISVPNAADKVGSLLVMVQQAASLTVH